MWGALVGVALSDLTEEGAAGVGEVMLCHSDASSGMYSEDLDEQLPAPPLPPLPLGLLQAASKSWTNFCTCSSLEVLADPIGDKTSVS